MSLPKDNQAKQPPQATGPADKPPYNTLRPDTVYRLRGVPARFQRSDIPGLLREALHTTNEFPVKVGSLAQNPYRVNEKIATVTLPEASSFLRSGGANEDIRLQWSLSLHMREEDDVCLRLDIHFHGFTPLHDGEDADCTRDFYDHGLWWILTDGETSIIAVSGLNGHAFGSFKQRGGPWMWLRDGLPKDLPNTRIFIYGYDTQLQGSSSIQTLTDVGLSLRTALKDLLQTTGAGHRLRPLVFIGHSLGGLVIKEAFVCMKDPIYVKILEATCGFLFFGVPNLGMAIGSLVPMVGDQPNRAFLETLGRNCALLRYLQEQFPATLVPRPVQTICFYETKLSRTACEVSGVWKMQGPEDLLVDFASATVGNNHYHPIDRDHSDMVKFNDADDLNYWAVLNHMRQLNGGLTAPMQGITARLSEDDRECLSSLAFPDQDWHKDGVVSTDGTCNWIFSHGTFKDWDVSPRQLLWIRGNPGTGKSTMLKHIFQVFDTRGHEGHTLATFFFNGRGLTSRFKAYQAARKGSWEWSVDELRRHFAKVVPAIAAKRHIYILVDALDESGEENARELIEQFQETLAAVNEAGGVLKICFSCRHYPILTLEDGMTITMETENHKDIEKFIKKRLNPLEGEASVVGEVILQKAQGVFQWAKLVANQALNLKRKGKNVKNILVRIQDTPMELKELYRSLLLKYDEDEEQEDRKKALELFQWVFFAREPFTFTHVQCVLDIDQQMKNTPVEEYIEAMRSMEVWNRVRRVVKTISRGLVEFCLQEHWGYTEGVFVLQPIHQTVQEYLLETGLRELQGSIIGGPVAGPHYQIFKTSVKILFLEGVLEKPRTGGKGLKPVLIYSLKHLGYHLLNADQKEIDPEEMLDLFQWPSKFQMPTKWTEWRRMNNVYLDNPWIRVPHYSATEGRWYFEWPANSGSTLLHLAAFVGNVGILESAIRRDNGHYLHAEDEMEWTPLSIAVVQGHEEFAVRILSHNQDFEIKLIDIHRVGLPPTTITHEAARRGLNRTLEKLLEIGADVNHLDESEKTPLLVAAREGPLEACRILLNNQANPEISSRHWGTPLSVAITYHNRELCSLLVRNRDEEQSRSPAPTRADVYNALWPTISDEGGKYRAYAYRFRDLIFERISHQAHADFIRDVLGPISTPLHDACARGNTKVASFLISKAGFDINRKDDKGRTPIFRAVQEEQHDMIVWLLRNHRVRYLSGDDWLQLPESATVETYRQAVEETWCGPLGFLLSQMLRDPELEQSRQLALKALGDSQHCVRLEEAHVSHLQDPKLNPSSIPSTTFDEGEDSGAKRRRIDGGGYI